jgi:hypothetical protein
VPPRQIWLREGKSGLSGARDGPELTGMQPQLAMLFRYTRVVKVPTRVCSVVRRTAGVSGMKFGYQVDREEDSWVAVQSLGTDVSVVFGWRVVICRVYPL